MMKKKIQTITPYQIEKIMSNSINNAINKYKTYERLYRNLDAIGKKYLKAQSKLYKRQLFVIQDMILPAIKKICSNCERHCCHLYSPDRNIYIANTIGGFQFSDFLLVRFETELPEPNLNNLKKNLCPFWSKGCKLPADCRSFICLNWFCDQLKKELDMKAISKHLEKIKAILESFSVSRCLGFVFE